MTASCLHLANEMVKCNKMPELARVYGLLIGGTSARFLVARPIVDRCASGEHRIRVIITGDEAWSFDLRQSSNHSAAMDVDEPVTETSNARYPGFEIDLEPSETVPPSVIIENTPRLLGFELVKDFEGARTTSVKPEPIPFEGSITEEGARYPLLLAEIVKARISLIRSDLSNDTSDRVFIEPSTDSGIFYSTSGRSGRPTPASKGRLRSPFSGFPGDENMPPSPLAYRKAGRRYTLTKPSCAFELRLNRLLSSLFPAFFARLYSFQCHDNDTTTFVFEQLSPFIFRGDYLSSRFDRSDPTGVTRECAKFLMECAFGLHLLHKQASVVHSDISPRNIMFSSTEGVWKLIDFGQSLPIAESLRSVRTAGTRHFRAPEAEKSGIFTELSDIYSLGQIGFNCFLFMLNNICLDLDGEPGLVRAIDSVNSCFVWMSEYNPAQRRSLMEAMKTGMEVLEQLDDSHGSELSANIVYVAVRALVDADEEAAAAVEAPGPEASSPHIESLIFEKNNAPNSPRENLSGQEVSLEVFHSKGSGLNP